MPESTKVVSVGHDGVVKVVDLNQPETPIEFRLKGELDAIAVSPDGKSFVTGENVVFGLNRVAIRAMDDGRVLQRLTGHEYSVESAAFSPDGRLVATAGRYQDVLVHSTDGRLLKRITTNSRNESLQFTPDGKYLVELEKHWDSSGCFLRGWDLADWTSHVDCIPEFNWVKNFDFAADSSRLVATEEHAIAVVYWPEGELIAAAKSFAGRIRCVTISADGQTLVAGCDQGLVYVWNLAGIGLTSKRLPEPWTIRVGDHGITSVCLRSAADLDEQSSHPSKQAGDVKQIVVTAEDGTTTLWRLEKPSPRIPRPQSGVTPTTSNAFYSDRSVCSPRDPSIVYLRSTDGELAKFDVRTEAMTQIAQIDPDDESFFAVSGDERTMVAAAPDDLAIVDIDSGQVIQRLPKYQRPAKLCCGLAFQNDDEHLLALFSGYLCRYRMQPKSTSGRPAYATIPQVIRLPNNQGDQLLAVPGQDRFLVVTRSKLLQLDGDRLTVLMTAESRSDEFFQIGISPDGRLLAVARADHSIDVFEFGDQLRPIVKFRGHTGRVVHCRFTADHRTLVTWSADRTVRFWSLATGRELGTLRTPQSGYQGLLEIVDQERLMLTTQDGTPLQLWSAK